MPRKALNLITDAVLLTGQERARLVLKHAHQKMFVDGKGFLSDEEETALLRMPNKTVSREYNKYYNIYQKTPLIMGVITETYLRFKYHYETLRKAHLLLNLSAGIDFLNGVIKDNVKDKKTREQSLKLLQTLQTVETKEDKITFSWSIVFIKNTAVTAYGQACYFISMKKLVDDITEALAFNPFLGKDYDKAYKNYIEDVKGSIAEHNEIMIEATQRKLKEITGKDKAEEIDGLKDYLIPEPTFVKDFYSDWYERLFEETPKNV